MGNLSDLKKIQYDSYGGKQGAWLECEFFIEMEASDILGLQSTDVKDLLTENNYSTSQVLVHFTNVCITLTQMSAICREMV